MTQAAIEPRASRAEVSSGRLLHLGSRLALPLPHAGSPFAPRETEPRRRSLALIEGLALAGHVQAVITSAGRARCRFEVPAGVPVRTLPGQRGLPVLPTIAAVRQVGATATAVHIHTDGAAPLAPLGAAATASPVPVVVHFHGSVAVPMRTGRRSSLLDRIVESRIEEGLVRSAALVVTPTRRLGEVAADLGARHVAVVAPAVLHGGSATDARPSAPPPVTHIPPGDGPLVVAVGALSRRWSCGGLLAAIAAMPEARLVIAGTGSAQAAVQRQIAAHGLERVHLLPRVTWRDVERLVERAAVVASVPRAGEDPAAVLLAQSAGRALVLSAADGHDAMVTNDVDGLLVPSTDDDATAAAILRLLREPDLRDELGCGAARRAAARTWEVVAAAVTTATAAVL